MRGIPPASSIIISTGLFFLNSLYHFQARKYIVLIEYFLIIRIHSIISDSTAPSNELPNHVTLWPSCTNLTAYSKMTRSAQPARGCFISFHVRNSICFMNYFWRQSCKILLFLFVFFILKLSVKWCMQNMHNAFLFELLHLLQQFKMKGDVLLNGILSVLIWMRLFLLGIG